jgi:tRNA-specific 2-thiouridylase
MSSRERVVVAMSGGVDSAVAAARLLDEGFDVVGVTLHLWDYPDETGSGSHGRCCAPEDQYDARRTADALGFPHFTFDRRALFVETVVAPFVDAYLAGETPSPCATCNRGVKLRELFALADRLGAQHVATGHYARVVRGDDGAHFLAQGRDLTKDQSYFLYATPQAQLQRLRFPVGESTKAEVRAEAIARGLPGAAKGDSQELCFVGTKPHAYAAFVEARAAGRVRPGAIVDADGRELGQHEGIHHFTVGQRKGLGVAAPRPMYVTRIDPATGRVHLGDDVELLAPSAVIDDTVLAPRVELPCRARVRVRYRHEGSAAELVPYVGTSGSANAGALRVRFDEPVRAVTRGQIAVFYDGDRVLGGGRIAEVSAH